MNNLNLKIMIKKYITPTSIIFLWGLILIMISLLYPEYTRYYLYLSIIVIIPIAIISLIKQRKEDKVNDTKEFQSSIYRMLFMAVILGVFFFITKMNHI
jgi:L-asparagine transporter-like permease